MNKYTNSVALKKINCTFATGCCMDEFTEKYSRM